jgi:hypothetical protein
MGYVPGYILSASASPDGWPEKDRHIGGQKAELNFGAWGLLCVCVFVVFWVCVVFFCVRRLGMCR